MCLESLEKGKCKVFQVNVNVGTWVWEPVALHRAGSLVSVAEVLIAPWRSTDFGITVVSRQDWASLPEGDSEKDGLQQRTAF